MLTRSRRKNDERRRVHPLVWLLCGLIAGMGVGVAAMQARTPEALPVVNVEVPREPAAAPESAVQAIVDSVSPQEITSGAGQNPDITAQGTAGCQVVLVRTGEIFCSIQAAINAAQPHDVVLVRSGVYPENVMITGGRTITLRGEGNPVIISSSGATIGVQQASATISGFVLRGHDAGVAISDASSQTIIIQNSRFQMISEGQSGYGIVVTGGRATTLEVSESTFQGGSTNIEIDQGQEHSVKVDGVAFQMPRVVLHIKEGSGHHISLSPDVNIQTNGTTITLENSQHIVIDAHGVHLAEGSVQMGSGDTNVIHR